METVTKLRDFGAGSFESFFFKEIQDEAKEFKMTELPAGVSARRLRDNWQFTLEFGGRLDLNDLYNMIKCSLDTIKFYNEDVNHIEVLQNLFCNNLVNVPVNIYSIEGVNMFLNYIKEFDVTVHQIDTSKMVNCRIKSPVDKAIKVQDIAYIINTHGKKEICNEGDYVVHYTDGNFVRMSESEFNEQFETF